MRSSLERPRQHRQPPQRRRIGPMDVVDDEHGRTTLTEVAGQPHQPPGSGVHRIAARGRLARLGRERALRQPGRADGQLVPLRAGSQRLEQLPRHPPRGVLLERAAARAQHRSRHPCARAATGSREQRRLADTGRPLDHDHAPGPGTSGGEPAAKLPQLGIAIQQHRHPYGPYPGTVPTPEVTEKIVEASTMRPSPSRVDHRAPMTDPERTTMNTVEAPRATDALRARAHAAGIRPSTRPVAGVGSRHRPAARPGRARCRRELPGRRLRPGRDDAADGPAGRPDGPGDGRGYRRGARRTGTDDAARRGPPPMRVRKRRPEHGRPAARRAVRPRLRPAAALSPTAAGPDAGAAVGRRGARRPPARAGLRPARHRRAAAARQHRRAQARAGGGVHRRGRRCA